MCVVVRGCVCVLLDVWLHEGLKFKSFWSSQKVCFGMVLWAIAKRTSFLTEKCGQPPEWHKFAPKAHLIHGCGQQPKWLQICILRLICSLGIFGRRHGRTSHKDKEQDTGSFLYIYIYIYMYIHIHMCIFYIYVYIHIYIYICICICVYIYIYTCTCVCVHRCIYIYHE